jgi:hypothetical protein
MKIRPVAAEFHADMKLMVAFRNFANAPNNSRTDMCVPSWYYYYYYYLLIKFRSPTNDKQVGSAVRNREVDASC